MRALLAAIVILLFLQASFASDVGTEGGNITDVNGNQTRGTHYWAAIVGILNGSAADITKPVSSQDTPNTTVYFNEPNGSYSVYQNFILVLTRLPTKPDISHISPPSATDFNQSGFFNGFSIFSGVNFTADIESPQNTFTNPMQTTTCRILYSSFTCPYIVVAPNIQMGILKFDNGTVSEPLFVMMISKRTGYNGSVFDFEYMVPANETYYFYLYEVLTPPPPPPNPPSGGGGGTQTPYYPNKPIPPQPPGLSFGIVPKPIDITIDYPQEGKGLFNLTSNLPLSELHCEVLGDFGRYATVVLESSDISENGTIQGTIIVSMTPEEILDYSAGLSGLLVCEGALNDTANGTAEAQVYLTINKPVLTMMNKTYEALPGTVINGTTTLTNTGPGNATAINITGPIYPNDFFAMIDWPHGLPAGGSGPVTFIIRIPDDMAPGIHVLHINFYENGRLIGGGYIVVDVLPKKPVQPVTCAVPDLRWTVIILAAGLMVSMILFKKKYEDVERDEQRKQRLS